MADLGQALVVIINNSVIAALFINGHEAVKQNNLTSGAQAHLFIF